MNHFFQTQISAITSTLDLSVSVIIIITLDLYIYIYENRRISANTNAENNYFLFKYLKSEESIQWHSKRSSVVIVTDQ